MGREPEIEKKFSENLDRILAGEEIKPDPAMDDDLRSALDFSTRIKDLRASPTQQFQAQQWSAAALTIADLCHYVGDGCQPLHCTENYNGQLTGNTIA